LGFGGQTVTSYRDGDREIPVVLRLASKETGAEPRIEDVYVTSGNGAPVRVGDVARSRVIGEDSRLVRRNGQRTLSIFGYSDGSRSHLAVFEDLWDHVKSLSLPGGVKVSYDGDKRDRELSFLEIGMVSAIGVLFNVLAVSALFGNPRIVAAIMFATPLSLTGGIAGLLIAHQPFGFMAVIGIVALGGVVTNHTIMLFEYAEERRRQGEGALESLVGAGKDRFRPILLTVLLSIMGLIPQAVNGGSLWPPLAYPLIFGLLLSLLISLVVVPSLFALMSRGAERRNRAATSGGRN
jgi:multidrug efflux pump subunit AcrB